MTDDGCSDWMVGGSVSTTDGIHTIQGPGLFHGNPESAWARLGHNQATARALIRQQGRVLMSADHGLWSWDRAATSWTQLHDETLTEIHAIAASPGDPGVLAGCPYGVATARWTPLDGGLGDGMGDESGVARWRFFSDTLTPDERYTNALLVDPNDHSRWLAGTEAGILIYTGTGTQVARSDLFDTPVRCLYRWQDRFWAGTDDRGILSSADGIHWIVAGGDIEGPVYAMSCAGRGLAAATGHGLVAGDGEGLWQRLGPRLLFAAVAVDPTDPDTWLAGASPGGLWHTADAGHTWRQISPFKDVRTVLAPENAIEERE